MNINRLLDPLRVRMRQLMVKGVISMIDDAGPLQRIQAKIMGEPSDLIEHYQPYGLASKAKKGALGLFLAIGGHRAHTIAALITDPRYRLKNLQDGEVALYDDLGNVIHLKRDRILIKSIGAGGLEIQAQVNIVGGLKVNGLSVVLEPIP